MARLRGVVLAFALSTVGVGCEKTKPVDAPSTFASSLTAGKTPLTSNPSSLTTMPANGHVKARENGSNARAVNLVGDLKKDKGNVAFSPASISMAFAMTYGGARGETASQMKPVFHFDDEPAALVASWGGLSRGL